MSGLLDVLNNPMMAAAVGLLQPTPSGSFGAALGNAYPMMAAQQRSNDLSMLAASTEAMRQQQMKALEERKKREEAARQAMTGLLGQQGGPGAPFQPDMFPGETPQSLSGQDTGGLLNQGTPATGMYATNPQMAGLLAQMGQIDPMTTMQAMVTPALSQAAQGPQSAIAKLVSDLNAGRITEEQYNQGMGILMKPMIQMPPSGWVADPNNPGAVMRQPGYRTPTEETEYRKNAFVLEKVSNALNNYERLVKKHGAELLPGGDQKELEQAYRDLQLELKGEGVYNLGVLTGPDMALMESVLMDPTSFAAKGIELWQGQDPMLNQIKALRNKIQQNKEWLRIQYGMETPKAGKIDRTGGSKPGGGNAPEDRRKGYRVLE